MSWVFEADMTDVPVYGGNIAAQTGLYKVRYLKGEVAPTDKQNDKHGRTQLWLDFEVTEGEFAGATIREFVNCPDAKKGTPEEKAKANRDAIGWFKGILVAFGVPEEKLNIKAKIGPKNFEGKTGHLDYTAKNEAMGVQYDKRQWVTPARFEVLKATRAAAPAATGANGAANATDGVKADTKGKATQRKKKDEPEPEPEAAASAGEVDNGDPMAFVDI